MTTRRKTGFDAFSLVTVLALLLWTAWAVAQTYPSRSIRIVVPLAAGGPGDILARAIGQKLSESVGQPVVIDNRPGANTNIGTEAVAKWTADGGAVPAALAVGATRERTSAPF